MNSHSYTSIKDVSQRIALVSELAHTLKHLYCNIDTADIKVIRKYESDFSTNKMDLVEWLLDETNYELFKVSPDAKKALLFKQIKDGLYEHEIGLETALRDKIYRDFIENFNLSSPTELLTENEARYLDSSEINNDLFAQQHKLLLNVYSKERAFERTWKYVRNNLPGKDLMDKDTQSLYALIEQNPHYLIDSPNHFLKNKGSYKGMAPTLADVFNVIQQSCVGSPFAKEKIQKYLKLFKDFSENKPEKEIILTTREKSSPQNTLGKQLKNILQ